LAYTIDNDSLNPADNKYTVKNDRIMIVNVTTFLTQVSVTADKYHEYDLRDPVSKVMFPDTNPTEKTMIATDEWKNIPNMERVSTLFTSKGAGDQLNTRVNIQKNIQQQKQQQQQQQQSTQQNPHQQHQQSINVYAAEYARRIGIPQRATTSANIGLGGVRR
jgi:hypothetical protein